MNTTVLRQILSYLASSDVSDYILKCETMTREYKFSISDIFLVEITDKVSKQIMCTEFNKVEEIPLERMKPKMIKEIRYTATAVLLETKRRNIIKEADLLLYLFRILKENAVFVLKNDSITRTCYYISSRTIYIRSSDRVHELVETNLFKLYNSMPNAEMVMFSPLPKRYSCKNFYTEQTNTARRLGKTFRDCKEGVGVG